MHGTVVVDYLETSHGKKNFHLVENYDSSELNLVNAGKSTTTPNKLD